MDDFTLVGVKAQAAPTLMAHAAPSFAIVPSHTVSAPCAPASAHSASVIAGSASFARYRTRTRPA